MKNLRLISKEELQEFIHTYNQPSYRGQQIWDWIWNKHAATIDEMSNLPQSLRSMLSEHFNIPKVGVHFQQKSNDGTIKCSLKLDDNRYVEGVLIPTDTRMTACVSSQVGCSLSCKFCATGFMPRSRNMTYDEIVDEVTLINQLALDNYNQKLSNIVFMGMGEPLLNYANVVKAIDIISSKDNLGMSPRRITVSTAGIAKMIKKLGDDEVRFNLALSLHAANDAKREKIMPINESNNLKSLIDAINYYYSKTHNKVSLEYILFKDLNDSIQDAEELIKVYRRIPAHMVNIIEYNSVDGTEFQKPDPQVADAFVQHLLNKKVNARVRRSRGQDIDAACGQLANKS